MKLKLNLEVYDGDVRRTRSCYSIDVGEWYDQWTSWHVMRMAGLAARRAIWDIKGHLREMFHEEIGDEWHGP